MAEGGMSPMVNPGTRAAIFVPTALFSLLAGGDFARESKGPSRAKAPPAKRWEKAMGTRMENHRRNIKRHFQPRSQGLFPGLGAGRPRKKAVGTSLRLFQSQNASRVFRPHYAGGNQTPTFSNSFGLKNVFEKHCFRDGLVWTVGLTVENKTSNSFLCIMVKITYGFKICITTATNRWECRIFSRPAPFASVEILEYKI